MMPQPKPAPTSPPQPYRQSDPFVSYSRSLHEYTLKLWTESRRLAEEKARLKMVKRDVGGRRKGTTSPQSDVSGESL